MQRDLEFGKRSHLITYEAIINIKGLRILFQEETKFCLWEKKSGKIKDRLLSIGGHFLIIPTRYEKHGLAYVQYYENIENLGDV